MAPLTSSESSESSSKETAPKPVSVQPDRKPTPPLSSLSAIDYLDEEWNQSFSEIDVPDTRSSDNQAHTIPSVSTGALDVPSPPLHHGNANSPPPNKTVPMMNPNPTFQFNSLPSVPQTWPCNTGPVSPPSTAPENLSNPYLLPPIITPFTPLPGLLPLAPTISEQDVPTTPINLASPVNPPRPPNQPGFGLKPPFNVRPVTSPFNPKIIPTAPGSGLQPGQTLPQPIPPQVVPPQVPRPPPPEAPQNISPSILRSFPVDIPQTAFGFPPGFPGFTGPPFSMQE